MILTFEIEKVQPGMYRTHALYGGVEVGEPRTCASIAEAIRQQALAVPSHFAHFLEVRYDGVSSGTIACAEAITYAETIADKLMAILAEMHLLAGQ